MNQIVFMAALLFEKGILTKGEASAIAKMASNETLSDNLQEMVYRVGMALKNNQRRKLVDVDEIEAKDLLNRIK